MRRRIWLWLAAASAVLGWRLARRRSTPKAIEEQVRIGLRDSVAGWWVGLVVHEFEYLVFDYGYSLVEVRLHFRGNYIVYRGPVYEVHTEFDPESNSISAELWVRADLERGDLSVVDRHPRALSVNRLLSARDPSLRLPETQPARLDREHVSEAVATWARGLRELAPDVLAGGWPTGVEFGHLW